jgi:hypothetical protein
MAVMKNSLMQDISGALGTLLFRNVQGRIIVSARPSELPRSWKRRQTPIQKFNRDRFREATHYAKAMMRDPAMKEYYWQIARKLKLPNGYTAAIADFLRNTKIESVNTKRYTGKVGGSIFITARKKDFSINEVNVTLTTKEGKEIEKGKAAKTLSGQWIYRNTLHSSSPEDITILIETTDRIGNRTYARLIPHKKLDCFHWKAGCP